MTVAQLLTALQRIDARHLNLQVAVEGWNDMGDLTQIELRGDLRLEHDSMGTPRVIIR